MGGLGTVLRERYELIAEIGRGGMSEVFLARDLTLDSYWAVKKVKNTASVEFNAFKKEVALLASLNHSDIPRITERIEVGDDYYVVMDFVDGASLNRRVLKEGPQAEADVVEWAKQLCDILGYLHTVRANPIVYCDMKPDNIMLTQAGRVKLIDFGIAKECQRGQKHEGKSVGTKGYAAPEQYKGASNRLDERTDIYSLGATLYYLVTGVAPGLPPNGVPPVRKVNPSVSEGLHYVIAKCTADNPQERYQNTVELRADLDAIESLTSTYRKRMSRRLGSFISCLVASVVFLGCGYIGYNGRLAEQQDMFTTALQQATNYERSGDYANAAIYYAEAISHKPGDYDTHNSLLNALLPREDSEDYVLQLKAAIDEMRKMYLDNPQSPMYQNPSLMYRVVQYCLEVDDALYASYAVDYLEAIRASSAYKNNEFDTRYIDSYAVLAYYMANEVGQQDYVQFENALKQLVEATNESTFSVDERLENYYIAVRMYSTYAGELESSPEQIYAIGHQARSLLNSITGTQDSTFTGTIQLYELVAVSQYNSGASLVDSTAKEEAYNNCIEWFAYLDGLDVSLSESMRLKLAYAHKGIFDIYNTPQSQGNVGEGALVHLDAAIELYRGLLAEDPNSFYGNLNMTVALLDALYNDSEGARANENEILRYYRETERIRNASGNDLPVVALSQFSALKQEMTLAGLLGGE